MAIVVLGVLIHFNYQNIFNSYPDDITIDVELEGSFQMLSIAIIVLGSVLFLIAFSGCCGAVTETKCLLVMVRKCKYYGLERISFITMYRYIST